MNTHKSILALGLLFATTTAFAGGFSFSLNSNGLSIGYASDDFAIGLYQSDVVYPCYLCGYDLSSQVGLVLSWGDWSSDYHDLICDRCGHEGRYEIHRNHRRPIVKPRPQPAPKPKPKPKPAVKQPAPKPQPKPKPTVKQPAPKPKKEKVASATPPKGAGKAPNKNTPKSAPKHSEKPKAKGKR